MLEYTRWMTWFMVAFGGVGECRPPDYHKKVLAIGVRV